MFFIIPDGPIHNFLFCLVTSFLHTLHIHICYHLSCHKHEEIASFSYCYLPINYSCNKGKLGPRICGKRSAYEIYLFVYCFFDAFWCQRKIQCLISLILKQIARQHLGVICCGSYKNMIHIPRGYGVFCWCLF